MTESMEATKDFWGCAKRIYLIWEAPMSKIWKKNLRKNNLSVLKSINFIYIWANNSVYIKNNCALMKILGKQNLYLETLNRVKKKKNSK